MHTSSFPLPVPLTGILAADLKIAFKDSYSYSGQTLRFFLEIKRQEFGHCNIPFPPSKKQGHHPYVQDNLRSGSIVRAYYREMREMFII